MLSQIARAAVVFLLVSAAIHLGIAAFLIATGKAEKPNSNLKGLAFQEAFIDYAGIPPLKSFTARDGKQLSYRHYPARSGKMLVLLHGSGWHSRYFLPLSRFISSENLAQVYTPDLRGHGPAPERRGDIDTIDQLEDDLADFIAFLRRENPEATLILGGHSSGGGLCLRFAGSRYGQHADAFLLLAPWLKYNAPTVRPNSGGWARPNIRRIIGLEMLNFMRIRRFNHLKVIFFDMPEEARDGTETLAYSYRLNTGLAPRNYQKDLAAIKQPLFVLAGTADELFFPERFESVIAPLAQAKVMLLPGVTHMGAALDPAVGPAVRPWLESLPTVPEHKRERARRPR
jgi:alpha-beta hydrolase superfamily lysophospholipase